MSLSELQSNGISPFAQFASMPERVNVYTYEHGAFVSTFCIIQLEIMRHV